MPLLRRRWQWRFDVERSLHVTSPRTGRSNEQTCLIGLNLLRPVKNTGAKGEAYRWLPIVDVPINNVEEAGVVSVKF